MRDGIVMSAYDEARENGEKHSVGVRQAAKVAKQRHPKLRISESGVRRSLAQHRPKKSQTILRYSRVTLAGEDLAKHHGFLAQMAAMSQKNEVDSSAPPAADATRPVTVYKISFGERPNYPRHNRKPINGIPPANL